ncbi:MAG: AtpZ/AtpI family protein [Euzebya sp.]
MATDNGLGDFQETDHVDDIESVSLVTGARTTAAHKPTWAQRYADGAQTAEEKRELWKDFDNSWVMVSELVGATLTWGGVGWLADRLLGLAPLLMSLGFVVGFWCGFYLIWGRSTGRITRHESAQSQSAAADLEGRAA